MPSRSLERVRDALDHAAGVGEDDRRAVRGDQLDDAVVDRAAMLVGGDRPELEVGGHLDREVQRPAMPAVDDRAAGRGVGVATRRADEQTGDLFDRLLRRRQPDALQRPPRERVEPLERQREVRAALVGGDRVDLVDDDGLGALEDAAALLGGEQDVERLRRRDEDVRRALRS